MTNKLSRALVAVAIVALASAPAFAKGPRGSALDVAPADLNCTMDAGTITCTWTAIDNTTVKKYAIAILAGYDSVEDATCEADFWLDWDFTVPAATTEFSFTADDLEYCSDPLDEATCMNPVSIEMVKVKGLTVPKKDGGSNAGSQNNPFAVFDTPFGLCPAS